MPFWMPSWSPCARCGQRLTAADTVLLLPPAWLERWDPMANFRAAAFHSECWLAWPHRQRFVDRVNQTDSGYRMSTDGDWTFVGQRSVTQNES